MVVKRPAMMDHCKQSRMESWRKGGLGHFCVLQVVTGRCREIVTVGLLWVGVPSHARTIKIHHSCRRTFPLHIYLEAGKLRRVFYSCNLSLYNPNGLRNVEEAFQAAEHVEWSNINNTRV